jgi:hypothetical protein
MSPALILQDRAQSDMGYHYSVLSLSLQLQIMVDAHTGARRQATSGTDQLFSNIAGIERNIS